MTTTKEFTSLLTDHKICSATHNPQESIKFIKKTVLISVSSILRKRFNFERKDFLNRKFKNIQYSIIKKSPKNSNLLQITDWLDDVIDALEKHYLREVYISFYNYADPSTVHETYKFQIQYLGKDVIPIKRHVPEEQLKEDTMNLLKAINCLEEHSILQEDKVGIKMAMSYYEDVTPPDYCPRHFCIEPGKNNVVAQLSHNSKHYFELGNLNTGFHVVKCGAQGDLFQSGNNFDSEQNGQAITNMETDEVVNEVVVGDAIADKNDSQNLSLANVTLDNDNTHKENVRCQCGINVRFSNIDMIMCSGCLNSQHCPCMKYLILKHTSGNHLCGQCDTTKNLTEGEISKNKLRAAYRLILAFIHISRNFPCAIFDHLSDQNKKNIMTILKRMGVIVEENGQHTLHEEAINEGILRKVFVNSVPYVYSRSQKKQDNFEISSLQSPEKRIKLG